MTDRYPCPIVPGLYRGRDYGDGKRLLLRVITVGPSSRGPGSWVWFQREGPGWQTENEEGQHAPEKLFRKFAAELLEAP